MSVEQFAESIGEDYYHDVVSSEFGTCKFDDEDGPDKGRTSIAAVRFEAEDATEFKCVDCDCELYADEDFHWPDFGPACWFCLHARYVNMHALASRLAKERFDAEAPVQAAEDDGQ